jgi:hypothetical protein
LRLVLGVVAGPDRRDPFSLMEPIGREPDPQAVRALRIAFSPTLGLDDAPAPLAANAAVRWSIETSHMSALFAASRVEP